MPLHRSTVIQISRLQSKKEILTSYAYYYPLDMHTYTCTEYLSPDNFLWREVEGASVGQVYLNLLAGVWLESYI